MEKAKRLRETKVSSEQMSQFVDFLAEPEKAVITMKPHPLKRGEINKL